MGSSLDDKDDTFLLTLDTLPADIGIFLLAVIWICGTVYMARKFYGHKENSRGAGQRAKSKISPRNKRLTMYYLVAYTVFIVVVMALVFLASIGKFDMLTARQSTASGHLVFQILCIMATASGIVGFCSLYCLVISRMYGVFKETYLPMSKASVIMFAVATLTATLLFCFWGISYQLFRDAYPFYTELTFGAFGLAMFISCCVSISIVYTFVHKLGQIILLNVGDETPTERMRNKRLSRSANSTTNLTHIQETLVYLIVKTMFLSILEVVIFNILLPVSLVPYVFLLPQNHTTLLTTVCVALYLMSLEACCVLLEVESNKKYYNSCCGKCHEILMDHCVDRTERKIHRHRTILRLESESDRDRSANNYNVEDVIADDSEYNSEVPLNVDES